jgi:hypothetical protein
MHMAQEQRRPQRGRNVLEPPNQKVKVVKRAKNSLPAVRQYLQFNRRSAGQSEPCNIVLQQIVQRPRCTRGVGRVQEKIQRHSLSLDGFQFAFAARQASTACCQCGPLFRSSAPMALTSSFASAASAVRVYVTATAVCDSSIAVSRRSITLIRRSGITDTYCTRPVAGRTPCHPNTVMRAMLHREHRALHVFRRPRIKKLRIPVLARPAPLALRSQTAEPRELSGAAILNSKVLVT